MECDRMRKTKDEVVYKGFVNRKSRFEKFSPHYIYAAFVFQFIAYWVNILETRWGENGLFVTNTRFLNDVESKRTLLTYFESFWIKTFIKWRHRLLFDSSQWMTAVKSVGIDKFSQISPDFDNFERMRMEQFGKMDRMTFQD